MNAKVANPTNMFESQSIHCEDGQREDDNREHDQHDEIDHLHDKPGEDERSLFLGNTDQEQNIGNDGDSPTGDHGSVKWPSLGHRLVGGEFVNKSTKWWTVQDECHQSKDFDPGAEIEAEAAFLATHFVSHNFVNFVIR